MGDRGIIEFNEGSAKFGFYSHWGGGELVDEVRNVLASNPGVAGRLRGGDLQYGYRGVIHGLLLAFHPRGVEETGIGIGDVDWMDDSNHGVVLRFLADGTIEADGRTMTIDEFLEA